MIFVILLKKIGNESFKVFICSGIDCLMWLTLSIENPFLLIYDDLIISKEIIVNGFKKARMINGFYKTSEEEKISILYSFCLYNDIYVIDDDLGNKLKFFFSFNLMEKF